MILLNQQPKAEAFFDTWLLETCKCNELLLELRESMYNYRVRGVVVEESVAVSCLLLNLTHDGGVVPSASNAIGANLLGTVIIVQHRYFSSTLPY